MALVGYKIASYDLERDVIVSGADSSISLPTQIGSLHTMPYPGIFLGSTRRFVLDYYLIFETNALLTYEFDPADVTRGDVRDRESEIVVSKARLVSVELFDEDGAPIQRLPQRGSSRLSRRR
jgi:hypothetical protein